MERASKSPHLSVVAATNETTRPRLTRAQVAERLGTSISTVRRYEGAKLHPQPDADGVNWFDPKEVTALAAERANEQGTRRRNAGPAAKSEARTEGELAALVFERFEQRQSLAEIVVGLRVTPDAVRVLFDQWSVGLTEGQLRMARGPTVQRDHEIPRATPQTLADCLASLPDTQVTRISVARYRGSFQHGDLEYAECIELGGFLVSGACSATEITRRFGRGDYRVTAYGFEPSGLRWEFVVEDVR